MRVIKRVEPKPEIKTRVIECDSCTSTLEIDFPGDVETAGRYPSIYDARVYVSAHYIICPVCNHAVIVQV